MRSITLQVAKRGLITLPKVLREEYGIDAGDVVTLLDLGGVLVLNLKPSRLDVLAERLEAEWLARGETLESMLLAVREERGKYGR